MTTDKKYAPALRSYVDAFNLKNYELANIFSVSAAQASRILRCESGLTRTNAKRFCNAVGIPEDKSEMIYEVTVTDDFIRNIKLGNPVSEMLYPKPSQTDGTYGTIAIPEYNVAASAGNGEIIDLEDEDKKWIIPLKDLLGMTEHPDNLGIIKIVGTSMIPDYLPGEKILIDTFFTEFIGDGIYVLDFGHGLIVKHVQLVLNSNPTKIKIISSNKTYVTQEVLLNETKIKAKVVSKWIRQ